MHINVHKLSQIRAMSSALVPENVLKSMGVRWDQQIVATYIHREYPMCWLRCNGSFRIQRPNRIKSDHIRSLFSRSSRFSQIQKTTYIHLSNFQSARVRGGRTRKASALRNENPRRESDRATRVDLTYPMDDTQWCNFELAPVPF